MFFLHKFNQAKYNYYDEIMLKELRQILRQEHEEQFVKERLCFLFIDEHKAQKDKKKIKWKNFASTEMLLDFETQIIFWNILNS